MVRLCAGDATDVVAQNAKRLPTRSSTLGKTVVRTLVHKMCGDCWMGLVMMVSCTERDP